MSIIDFFRRSEPINLSQEKLGDLIRPFFKEAPEEFFMRPLVSPLGGTPQYTYLQILDWWYVISHNSKFSFLDSFEKKFEWELKTRQYTDVQKDKIRRTNPKNYRDAILAMLDLEFLEDNPYDPSGERYKKQKQDLLQQIDDIEAAYKKERRIESIE